jgi:hypothetical protein
MIYLGKIVHKEPLVNHKPLPHIFYQNLNDTPKDKKVLPTLIVGWKLVNELFPKYEHDIIEKDLHIRTKCKHVWEFSPKEDIVQYSQGLDFFIKKVPYLFISKYQYKNADPIFNNLFTVRDLSKFLPAGGSLYVYKNDMAYYLHEETIFGIKLTVYDYMRIKSSSVIEFLKSISTRHLIDDSTEYQKYYKEFPEFSFLKRSMVVLLFS